MAFSNIFGMLAYLLFEARQAMEVERDGRPPRWLRIARARETQGESDGFGRAVKEGVQGFVNAVSMLSELVLDIEEVLIQTDAVKAFVELRNKVVEATTTPDFTQGIKAMTGVDIDSRITSALKVGIEAMDDVLDYIPEPDDIAGISHELFRLQCLEQWPLPPRTNDSLLQVLNDASTGPEDHVVFKVTGGTGKLRLLQWAYSLESTVHGLGPAANPESSLVENISRLGSRRLSSQGALATGSRGVWTRTQRPFEIFEFSYSTAPYDTKDIEEANQILTELGYYYYPIGAPEPMLATSATDDMKKDISELERRLERFQEVNDIPVTGQLDNATLNRLYNLDFDRQCLSRAKPYDGQVTAVDPNVQQRSGYFNLVNHDADSPPNGASTDKDSYPYYVASQIVPLMNPPIGPAPTGWLTDERNTIVVPDESQASGWNSSVLRVQGFAGMHSRKLIPGPDDREVYDFHDGSSWTISEGESANGKYFFCALATQPWIAARRGSLDENSDVLFPLYNNNEPPPVNALSQMYQWVDLTPLLTAQTDWGVTSTDMYLRASCLVRSLYQENKNVIDQCRIRLELYQASDLGGILARPDVAADPKPPHAHSEWFPSSDSVNPAIYLSYKACKRNWIYRETGDLKVENGMDSALVILEGRHSSGWDIDAYFDNVVLSWEFRNA